MVLFVDTNFFLHFQPVDQVDWPTLVGEDQVDLIVTSGILKELDDKKSSRRATIQKRAKKALKLLGAFTTESALLRPNVSLALEHREPEVLGVNMHTEELTPHNADDRLVGTVLAYVRSHEHGRVAVATEDVALRAKLAARSIEVVLPIEEMRLPDVKSDEEKELERLRRVQAPQPDLRVELLGASQGTLHLDRPAPLDEIEFRQRYRTEFWERHNLDPPIADFVFRSSNLNPRFFTELDDFRPRFEEYLNQLVAHELRARRMFHLDFVLHNDGTAPADEVELIVHVDPDSPVFLEQVPRSPQPPDPPKRTLSEVIAEATRFPLVRTLSRDLLGAPAAEPNVRGPDCAEQTATFWINRLRHVDSEELPRLWIAFAREPRNTTLVCTVHASNIPIPVQCQLHVIFGRGS